MAQDVRRSTSYKKVLRIYPVVARVEGLNKGTLCSQLIQTISKYVIYIYIYLNIYIYIYIYIYTYIYIYIYIYRERERERER